MKLYIMKREALETLKANLQIAYAKYYTESNNSWITDLCGEDAFIEFKEIPDFELAELDTGLGKGEIDLKNCKILYEKLMFLSESQASDERLWAGLTHATFYNYMRKRWGYGYGKKPKSAEKEAGELKSRFFYSGGTRAGFYRNTLAKCWWVGRNTYDASNGANHFERLDVIGSNDINSKVTEFFYNFTFSSNPYVLDGIINALRYFKNEGIAVSVREHIRPAMSYLNAVGGAVVIDCIPQEEITDIIVNTIQGIMQGDSFSISVDNEADDVDESDDATENVEDTSKYFEDKLQVEVGNDLEVALGCKVTVKYSDGKAKVYKYDYLNGRIPDMVQPLAGQSVGAMVVLDGHECVVEKIEL